MNSYEFDFEHYVNKFSKLYEKGQVVSRLTLICDLFEYDRLNKISDMIYVINMLVELDLLKETERDGMRYCYVVL